MGWDFPSYYQTPKFEAIWESGGFRVSPDAPFIWKLLLIDILRAMDHDKNLLNLEVGGAAPAHSTPPVFRVVL